MTSWRWSSRTATRTHRWPALHCAGARRHPGGRFAAHLGAAEGQAEGTPHRNVPQQTVVEGGRPVWPVRVRVHRGDHSIPDAWRSPSVRRPAWCCTRRLQDGPVALDNRITDLRAFAGSVRRRGLFCVDSTNSEVPGFNHPRARHRAGAGPRLHHAKQQRIIVACFASHVHRVQQ